VLQRLGSRDTPGRKLGALVGILACVDPGKWALGISIWENGRFTFGDYFQGNRCEMALAVARHNPELVVCEIPLVYPGRAAKGNDPNDLIQVAISAGAAMSACSRAVSVTPSEWKGQLPKEVHHARIDGELTLPMRMALRKVAPDKRHNLLDAIALGLWCHSEAGKGYLAGTKGMTL
jgi:hypothetical protein